MIRESVFEGLEKNFFRLSLIVSLLLHTIVFMFAFYQNVRLPKRIVRILPEQLVNYLVKAPAQNAQAKKLAVKPGSSLPSPVISSVASLTRKSATFPMPSAEVNITAEKTPTRLSLSDMPQAQNQDVVRGQIAIALLESATSKNPRHLSYHQQVRERIRKMAYTHLTDPRFQSGEVYLTFVVSSTGALKQVQIVPEKTKASDYLRQAGLKSIKDSNPFPSFPKDLKAPELTFNVVIDFKLSN